MGMAMFCVHFMLTALTVSVRSVLSNGDGHSGFYSNAVVQNIWPGFTVSTSGYGGFYDGQLQPSSLNELESSFPMPVPTWDFMSTGPDFALLVLNSSWNGLAKANVYQRGEPVYLKVTGQVPGQELYIHSCYAAPSPNPADKSRYALILNKGCVSSKQPMLEFVSRQSDAINLILDTSNLKFSKVYVHCSVVLSSFGLTQDTKSCNYIKSKSRWIDLGGETDVCDCCATKCSRTPYYEGLFSEFKAMVSTGPLTIMDKEHEKQLSVSNSTSITASQIAASATSTRENRIMSGASPLAGKGWIVSGATVSGSSVLNHPPFLSQPVTGDLIISLELGAPSWLTGFVKDQSSPVLEMGAGYPNQKGRAKITMLSQSSAPAESFWGKSEADVKAMMQKDPSKVFPELEFGHQELASADHYVADDPSLTSDRDFRNIPEPALEPFHASGEEKLRGDAFPNFREPQMENIPEMENSITSLHALPKSKVSEKVEDEDEVLVLTQTEMLYKVKGDVEPKPESVKRSKLTLTKASDGSSLLSFEEEWSPTAGKEAVRKSTLELKRMVEEKLEGSKKQDAEKELVSSLLDMLRGLKKMP